MQLPERYNPQEAEERWLREWDREKTYSFDPGSKAEIFSIDTPPPTFSGKMHLGHSFSYSQEDFIARYQRMKGKSVFYPFGTDDNGLPTEKLVEKLKKVRGKDMKRKDFVALCLETINEMRNDFVYDWKRIGISADFNVFYSTIDSHSQRISQRSFIELHKMGRIYRKYAPIIFCPQCQTAIAQVEMEDQKKKSTLNYLKAKMEDSFLIFATTRPEVLYGCVGMSIHQDGVYVKIDVNGEKWIVSKDSLINLGKKTDFSIIEEFKGKKLVGKEVIIPISNAKIPITHDEETKTQYGTGAVYYCTYGGDECVGWVTKPKG